MDTINLMPQVSPLLTIVHTIAIYLFLLVAFRLMGRYEFAQISPLDLVLLLIISESISSALSESDTSLGTALISAGTLLTLTWGMSYLKYRYPAMRKLMGEVPHKVIENGKVNRRVLRRELMTMDDLMGGLRESSVKDIRKVKEAFIEEDGEISVIPYGK